MDFLTENDLDREKYGNNLFILAYDSARGKSGKSLKDKFQMSERASLNLVREQFHDLLKLPFVTDGMLDSIRERLNEEASRNSGAKRASTTTSGARFHLVPLDGLLLAIVFIVVYSIEQSLIEALIWTGLSTLLYGITNKHIDAAKNSRVTVVKTNNGEKAGITFSELCSYGAELIEAHLRYTDSPTRPLS